jgi:transglutaminase-like putative cysteine protease
MTATYRVRHETEYQYESEVSASYGELHLLPRDTPTQTTGSTSVFIDPPPHDLRHRTDFFGNRASFFTVLSPHRALLVRTVTEVEVQDHGRGRLAETVPWEVAAQAGRADGEASGYLLDSPLVVRSPALADLAAPSFAPGRGLVEAVGDLMDRLADDFAYEPGATDVTTTLDEVLRRRAGVCQDFAHVLVGCLRATGLAARYVSGYLETQPPPGVARLQGADRSHAWASVWEPELGWIDVDPTNRLFVGDRHITTAWGRDYADVTPLKGVIYTAGSDHRLSVAVDVERIPA